MSDEVKKPPNDQEKVMMIAAAAVDCAVRATVEKDPVKAGQWLDTATKAYKAYAEMVHIASIIHITNKLGNK